MTNRILSKIALAAAVLASILPAVASAHDRDGDRDRDDRPIAVQPAPWQPAPPPAWGPPAAPPRAWRGREWRGRELARVSAELRALDADRAAFHARYAWRPGALRRYDRTYFERRAELERRLAELRRVAWR